MAAMQPRPPMPMAPHPGQPMQAPPPQQGQIQNPAQKIPFPLLPHVHLKSAQLYPHQSHLTLDAVLSYLHDARRVVNHLQPVEWTYLDPPPDGRVMLVWQAPGQIQLPSDGYVWVDAEQQMVKQIGNFNVEIYHQRCGYLPGEKVATHARRRFRLTPATVQNPPLCDPCLWLVHYLRADLEDQLPVEKIPANPMMLNVMHQRRMIENSGRLIRKPFMLSDPANWPTLQVPEQLMRPRTQSQVAAEGMEHAAKRQRQEDGKDDQEDEILDVIEVGPQDNDDDDKDLFDILTPRDISRHRYMRHSEWMEELLNSPYALSDMKVPSLGLGRGGGLRKLTKDFYVPALDERNIRDPVKYKGGDDAAQIITQSQVDGFEARIGAEVTKMRKEMEELEKAHERAVAQLRDNTLYGEAEIRLRYAVTQTDAEDPWGLEAGSHFKSEHSSRRQHELIGDIVQEVSSKIGLQTRTQPAFRCVDRGGYQTPPPPPSPPAESDKEDALDTEMGEGGFEDDSRFVDFVEGGEKGLSDRPHPDAQPKKVEGEGDDGWVVLDKAAGQAESAANGAAAPTQSGEAKAEDGSGAPASTVPAASTSAEGGSSAALADPTDDMLDFGAGDSNGTPGDDGLEGADFGESLDFGDLPEGDAGNDSGMDAAFPPAGAAGAAAATDAIPEPPADKPVDAASAAPNEAPAATDVDMDMGGDDTAPVDFEDSAFGDAFHHNEFEAGEGGEGGEGGASGDAM